MATGRLPLLRSPTAWALLGMFIADFALFDQVGSRHHTWIYPRWNDQVQYLTECYTGWEFARAHGFWSGLWHTLINPSAQGTLHDFAAVLVFAVAGGPSRSALLALNMLALIVWQGALFFAARRGLGSRALAWAAAALPLALAWPWNGRAGSTADFRLDHFSMCAFGITLAAALLADRFRSTRWSLVFGVAVGFTLLTRFLIGAYFTPIFLSCLGWVFCSADRCRRICNLALAALVAFAIAAPVFWLNRDWIWNYYGLGHFVGPESTVRSAHMGIVASTKFVWSNFFLGHLGPVFLIITSAASIVLIALAFAFRERRAATESNRTADATRASWLFLGATFLFAPAIVLTFESQKSAVVLGVLTPGLFAIILAIWSGLAERVGTRYPQRLHRAQQIGLAVFTVGFAGGYFAVRQFEPPSDVERSVDMRMINRLADRVFAETREEKLSRPWVGVSEVSPGIDALMLSVVCYERHRVWVPFAMTLPTGILAVDEKLVMERVALSDFFFLVVDGPVSNWPFDQQARGLLPTVREWCESNRHPIEQFEIFGHRMVLYRKSKFPPTDHEP